MAFNGVMTAPPLSAKVPPPPEIGNPTTVLKFFNPLPSPQTFYSPLQLEMAASAVFTYGYSQQAHVHKLGSYYD